MSEPDVRIPISWQDIKTKEMFACEPPSVLYHYTNYEGANGIVTSKALWLTKIQYLNDTSELHLTINLFREVVEKRAGQIEDEQKRDFLKGASNQLESFRSTNICVGSFCENGDLLSQWRAYGNLGSGVSLGFQGQALKSLSNKGRMNLWKCVYDRAVQVQIAHDLVDILLNSYHVIAEKRRTNPNWEKTKKDLVGYFNTTFLRIAPVLKDDHFNEEQEWRLITVSIPYTDKNYHARISNNRVAQYCSVDFNLLDSGKFEFIESIVIGPTREPDLVGNAFWVLLDDYGDKHKSIMYSRIPYRAI